MVKVFSMWEHGWNVPNIEINQWEFLCREFGVDGLYMYPITGILANSKLNLVEVNNFPEVLADTKNLTRVWVDEKGEINLRDFEHPENSLYIFGKSGTSFLNEKKSTDSSIFIPTPNNSALLFATEACAIVLYDRFLKGK